PADVVPRLRLVSSRHVHTATETIMAQRVRENIVGVDVSKDKWDVFELGTNEAYSVANEREAIEQWLGRWAVPVRLSIEPTNQYHLTVAQAAHARGHQVYLIDPYRLVHYREGVGQRVKADRQDAKLLARYLSREDGEIRRWAPMTQAEQRFWHLLKRRATLVRARTQLQQSLTDLGPVQSNVDTLLAQCHQTIRKMERALTAEAKRLGWIAKVRRCQAIPGVGPLTALAMVATYHRGPFRSADAFIAFMGMDVRVRDSGKYRGRRKLTKKGDSELRRLLFNAAMQDRRSALWEPYYLALRARSMSTTAAFVALGRKLARVCFALLQKNTGFNPIFPLKGCALT
ncbi:MAG: transposase, partial [Gammaproteobacteria bacterium]|nr:transposase [Gammaproteobacteria bacterium]